jgi:hypothetical protein
VPAKLISEQKILTDPADIIALLTSLDVTFGRIGIEAGPLSQWLVNALTTVDLPVVCVKTRHMKALLTAQQISKTDRSDARGIAQMMRVGLFKPVHVKTLIAEGIVPASAKPFTFHWRPKPASRRGLTDGVSPGGSPALSDISYTPRSSSREGAS